VGEARGEVLAAVAETARGLVALAAERAEAEAPAIEPDPARFEQLVASFPFTETADQLRGIAAIRADLASGKPMDRLVVGDVGSARPRSRLRAAGDGRVRRQAGRACRADNRARPPASRNLSRPLCRAWGRSGDAFALVTAAEKKRVLAGLADGSIAIVVGTGAVAGKGAVYKDLGLVIIDEEQRFLVRRQGKLRGCGRRPALSLTGAADSRARFRSAWYGHPARSASCATPPGAAPADPDLRSARPRRGPSCAPPCCK
jgi:transcription-repair coupling factor (superfamily II helicase)